MGSSVHLTRIYTRTGDQGTTAIGDGSRVAKTDPRVVVTADVDECNAALGVAIATTQLPPGLVTVLSAVQNELFDLGADFCNPVREQPESPPLRITAEYITRLEGWCDQFNTDLPVLNSFLLPGGSAGSALLNTARVLARRAERSGWALMEVDPDRTNPLALTYLNRLSDLLFILSRVANVALGHQEVRWAPGHLR
jgi:cob(I)alamin adenosyltransferase